MKILLAALLFLPVFAESQVLTTVNENLWTTNNSQYLDTVSGYMVVSGSVTVEGSGGVLTASSVTASAFFGDASHLSSIPSFSGGSVSGQTTFQSTVTIQGNALSVGGSSLVVAGGNVGIGTTSPGTILQVHKGTDENLWVRAGSDIGSGGGIGFDSLNDAESLVTGFGIRGTTITLLTDAGAALTVLSNKNVGIGTTSPSQTLSVNGPVSLNTNAGTQLYYCAGGTLSQIVIRGNSGAEATACVAGAGTVTALGIFVP